MPRTTLSVGAVMAVISGLGALALTDSVALRVQATSPRRLVLAGLSVGARVARPVANQATLRRSGVKILVVSHYFPPEIGAPQARLSDLARYWAEAGEQVTVLTGMPNHPTGVVPPEYRGQARGRRRPSTATGWSAPGCTPRPTSASFKKTLGHLSFMVSSVVLGARRARAGRRGGRLVAHLLLHPVGVGHRPGPAGPLRRRDP